MIGDDVCASNELQETMYHVKSWPSVDLWIVKTFKMMQGSEGNWEKVMAAGKEDVLALANFALLKANQLAVAIMEKYEEMETGKK